jgi:hypothetical protein
MGFSGFNPGQWLGQAYMGGPSRPPQDYTALFQLIADNLPFPELDGKKLAEICNSGWCGLGAIGWMLTMLGIQSQAGTQADTATDTDDNDDCTYDKIRQRIGNRTVAQVVGDVGNIRSGEPKYLLGAPPFGFLPSGGKGVIGKALEICKEGDTDISDYYICPAGVDCKGYRILSDGNAAFVARRVMGQSLAEIEQHLRPSPSRFAVFESQGAANYYLRHRFDWENIQWGLIR